jgi:hypothetical protein
MSPQPSDQVQPISRERRARYTHCTPPDVLMSEPSGDELTDALRHVLSQFGPHSHASHLLDHQSPGDRTPDGALLFALAAGVVHVVGSSPLAEQVRSVLGDGAVTGWRLLRLPETTSPLYTPASPPGAAVLQPARSQWVHQRRRSHRQPRCRTTPAPQRRTSIRGRPSRRRRRIGQPRTDHRPPGRFRGRPTAS